MAENFCGTGLWSGPKPGDPDNNVILSARPAFGGIDVSWTYPGINAHAVAHTILYRSTSGTEATKVQYQIVSGNFFYDKSDTATPIEYFYWIQIVSINGTIGELIGPASATARPTIEDTIIGLTGRIDAGVLAQSLKQDIAQIKLNTLGITQEILDRAENDAALGAAFNEVQAYTEETRSLVQNEILARAEADAAFVTSVNTVYANTEQNAAAIQVVSDARVAGDQALAKQITTTQSVLGDQIASVQTGLSTNIKTLNGKVTEIGALYTAKVSVNGLIGGFGVYNNGKEVQAGFDVDTFWIGRTGANKMKPFIVYNNEVFISEAVIRSLTFSKLRDEAGAFVVQGGKVKARYIEVDSASIKDASITSAKIANAAITTAKISNLAVDTLQIAGNAVTIPKFAKGGSLRGNGGTQTAVSLWFNVPANSWLYASSTGGVGYSREQGIDVGTSLVIGSNTIASASARFYYLNATHSGAVYFSSATSITVSLLFRADAGVVISDPGLFAMVVRR